VVSASRARWAGFDIGGELSRSHATFIGDTTRPTSEHDAGTVGSLDLLILKSLSCAPNHGYAIAMRISQLADEVLRIEEGSLYPALYRLEEQGLIESDWQMTENNRKAKFYSLTSTGRGAVQAELDGWWRLSKAVTKVLRALEQGA
jgi:transcriptional regulator